MGDSLSTVGDTFSTLDNLSSVGDSFSTVEGIQCSGRRIYPDRLWIITLTYLTGRTNKLQSILPRV